MMDHDKRTTKAMADFNALNLKRIEAVAEVLSENLNACTGDHRVIKLADEIVKRINRLDA